MAPQVAQSGAGVPDVTITGSLNRLIAHWKPITGLMVTIVSLTAAVIMAYTSRASASDLAAAKATLSEVDHVAKDLKERLEKLDLREAEDGKNLTRTIEKIGDDLNGKLDKLRDRFGELQAAIAKLTAEVEKANGP